MFINLLWQNRLVSEKTFFGLDKLLLLEMGFVSLLLEKNLNHTYTRTLKQQFYIHTTIHRFSNRKFDSPSSLFCVKAEIVKTDFDPPVLSSFLIQAQNKRKGAPAIQRQAVLVSPPLFPPEPQADQLPFEVSFMPGTKGQERVTILSPYLHFIQVI